MTSHSQAGEDLIVTAQFPLGFKGTLLEIGAWDPIAMSNSRAFIEAGWSAVLCEFSPTPVKALVKQYAGDGKVQVVSAAVTVGDDHVQMYQLSDDALSTNDPKVLLQWAKEGGYYGSLWVPTLPLVKLLSQFFGTRKLDYASIDTEGSSVDLALALLRTEHRPNVLCVEHDGRVGELMPVAQELGYSMIHYNGTNCILSGRW